MSNVQLLRTLVQNGWTRSTRQLFENTLGKEQFDMLKRAYSGVREEIPFIPKANNEGKDIFLSFNVDLERLDCPVNFSELPLMFRNKFKNGFQNFMESLFPKFKNNEIDLKNIVAKFQNIKFDAVQNKEDVFKAIGLNVKKESYSISDLIKLKHTGNTANLKRNPGFTSEIVTDKNKFYNEIKKYFSQNEMDLAGSENLFENITNYAIKHEGKTIGYFSLQAENGVLSVGNYVLYPEYRNSRASMNAILTVRDKIIEEAKQSGIKTVKAEVDANNPKLLGLYKRFGFQPNMRETYSFTDEAGKTITSDSYNLIGYLD